MGDETRRRLTDIIARYKLEPTLRDIYVEGRTDVHLISALVKKRRLREVRVYDIGAIDIPMSVLIAGNRLTDSKRSRLIFLSETLNSQLDSQITIGLACVVDRDFDPVVGEQKGNRFLVVLPHAGIESYFFDRSIVEKVITSSCENAPISDEAWKSICTALLEAYVQRAANVALAWGMQWVEFAKSCSVSGSGEISVDLVSFQQRYLSKNGRLSQASDFTAECDRIRALLTNHAAFLAVRGHDFLDLLGWYIGARGARAARLFGEEEVVFAMLKAADTHDRLAQCSTLADMLQRFT